MNLYESVTTKLKEAEELNSRVDDLVNSLKSEGYSVNTNDNRHFNVSSGSSELNMVIYEGGNNESDFEDDTIGLGGDTVGNTVYPLITQGWDYDDAAPYKVKKQEGESVYAIFNSLNQVSNDDIVRVINTAFNTHDKSKDKEEEIEVLDSESVKESNNVDYCVAMECDRRGYSPSQVINDTITVGELADYLSGLDQDMKIVTSHDDGYTYGAISTSDFRDEPIHEDDDDEEDYDESESNNENIKEVYNKYRKKTTTSDDLTEADNDLTALSEGIAKYIISIMQKDIDLTNKGVKINTTIQDNKIEVATYQDGKPVNVQLINIDEIKRSIK